MYDGMTLEACCTVRIFMLNITLNALHMQVQA